MIDGTSVMVQPSISRTYTFIIYYPCRYGYFASSTSCLPSSTDLARIALSALAPTPNDASARPKGRSGDDATFQPRTTSTRVCTPLYTLCCVILHVREIVPSVVLRLSTLTRRRGVSPRRVSSKVCLSHLLRIFTEIRS